MRYDVIVVGAGIGGLGCGAKLAARGKKVLLLERDDHIGGTSYIFRRNGYAFPMGPLAFSFPGRIRRFLADIGVSALPEFRRNDFELVAPPLDIVYSLPLNQVRETLKRFFPKESQGLDSFFGELAESISLAKDIDLWHPDYRLGQTPAPTPENLEERFARVRELARTPCRDRLARYFSDRRLIRFLGSQGTAEPEMSMLNLVFMWNVISAEGIWFPSCGIHGLNDMMADRLRQNGGEVKTRTTVGRILIRNGKAVGVATADGEVFDAEWIVSNADYKTTFLELTGTDDLPRSFCRSVTETPYTGSELCVFLGVNPSKVDFSRLNATHVFFREKEAPADSKAFDLEDFENREIEICRWSDNAPWSVPRGKAAVILRVSFPYDHFARFRAGEKKRVEGYKAYKMRLARNIVNTASHLLPGLDSAVDVLETATPLTYRDWGHRFRGSIAGWTWSAEYERALGQEILVETPVPNLLMVGIYAATKLFLGGVPTSVHTASLAADRILENS